MDESLAALGVKRNTLSLSFALQLTDRKRQSIAYYTKHSQIHVHGNTVTVLHLQDVNLPELGVK